MYIDPAQIRFQHSKIRPVFSGCGRSVEQTLQDIRDGKIHVTDLPPIQVLVGPAPNDTEQQQWYFSLNNRRLWVLKRLREEGLLEQYDNKVLVRVRTPKSEQERQRYTIQNCALEAKIVSESNYKSGKGKHKKNKPKDPSGDDKVEDVADRNSAHARTEGSSVPEDALGDEDDSDSDDTDSV
ncbi:MAG: hypothetical protein SGARI_001210, partial [Bacillariaceae sp.]